MDQHTNPLRSTDDPKPDGLPKVTFAGFHKVYILLFTLILYGSRAQRLMCPPGPRSTEFQLELLRALGPLLVIELFSRFSTRPFAFGDITYHLKAPLIGKH